MNNNDREARRMWQLAGQYSAVGIEMVVAVGVGALGGNWLDTRFGLSPWMTALGLVVGVGAAGLTVMRLVTQFKRLPERGKSAASDDSQPEGRDR